MRGRRFGQIYLVLWTLPRDHCLIRPLWMRATGQQILFSGGNAPVASFLCIDTVHSIQIHSLLPV